MDSWTEQIASYSRALKQSVSVTASDSYSDVVEHMTDQIWEEEREPFAPDCFEEMDDGCNIVQTDDSCLGAVWRQSVTT